MKKIADRIYVWGFVGVISVMSVLFVLLPKQDFSEMENRRLQSFPVLNWDRLLSKQFANGLEAFITDHFPFRNEWVSTKSMLEQLRLQKENNGIYFGKHGYLFEKFQAPDYKELASYVDAVKQFAANHPDVHLSFLLAPNSVGMYPEHLPWLASAYSQEKVHSWIAERMGDSATFLNGFDFLEPAAEKAAKPLYYRTDHHWTTYGAYIAYKAYAKQMGWKPLSETDFEISSVTDTFLGSYNTRLQFMGIRPDSIETYTPKNPVDSVMYIADSDTTVDSLYDESYLNKKDKYSYFQGGVHALVKVTTALKPEAVDMEKLLIIKDSYAHSMLPFLVNHVTEVHMIDIRFYNGNIGVYMKENGINNVLLLFNTSTFVKERGLLKLKY